jgi:hypothetical protein
VHSHFFRTFLLGNIRCKTIYVGSTPWFRQCQIDSAAMMPNTHCGGKIPGFTEALMVENIHCRS